MKNIFRCFSRLFKERHEMIVEDAPAIFSFETDDELSYDYLRELLEEEFEAEYLSFLQSGILHFELLNLQVLSSPVFEHYGFPRDEDSRFLRYELTGLIREYLNACN